MTDKVASSVFKCQSQQGESSNITSSNIASSNKLRHPPAAIGSEDIVCCKVGSTFKFGVVTQSYNDDTSSSSEGEDDDDYEDDDEEKVKEGFAKVAWFNVGLNGNETKMLESKKKKGGIEEQVIAERKLRLVDRALMPGDAVRRTNMASSTEGADNSSNKPQRGFVKKVELMFDVAMISNRDLRLYNVPAPRFSGPVPYSVGCFCVYNFYLGEIENVNNTVRFELRNGFVYEVKESIFRRYATDMHDPVEKYSYFHKSFFYPSQQVKVNGMVLESAVCVLASGASNCQKFEELKRQKFMKAEIVSIFTNSVKVSWIVRCYSGNSECPDYNDLECVPPKTLYNPQLKDLKMLTDYIYLSYSLGDKAMLKLTENDLSEMDCGHKKLHCGGAIKDHITDMKAKQMSRNKYGGGGGRFHNRRKQPVSKRFHHTAEVVPDSRQNTKVAIPPRPCSAITSDDVMNSFNQILELNRISTNQSFLLPPIASRSSYYISRTFLAEDFPSIIVELLVILKDRKQFRERDLVQFFLNGRTNRRNSSHENDCTSPDLPSSVNHRINSERSSVFESNLLEYASGDGSSQTKNLIYSDSERLPYQKSETGQISVNGDDLISKIKNSDSKLSRLSNGNSSETSTINDKREQQMNKCESPTSDCSAAPVFDSTIDLAKCLNNMLSAWKDVMQKRDPDWNDPDIDNGLGESSFSTEFEEIQDGDGAGSDTDGETETVSTFQTDRDENGVHSVNGQTDNRGSENMISGPFSGNTNSASVFKNSVRSLKPGDVAAFKIIMTKTLVTILWQDGTVEKDVPSTEVETLHHLDENEFFPGDFVVDTRKESSGLELYGIVQNADFWERVCTVKWFSDAANDRRAFLSKEQVSVYDISDLEHVDLNVLDIVARISEEDERPWIEEETITTNQTPAASQSSPLPEMFGTGTAGAVIDIQLSSGFVLVLWVEGYRSYVPHHCLININDSEMVSDLMHDDDETECLASSAEENDESAVETNDDHDDKDDSWTTASSNEDGDDVKSSKSPFEELVEYFADNMDADQKREMQKAANDESALSTDLSKMKVNPNLSEMPEVTKDAECSEVPSFSLSPVICRQDSKMIGSSHLSSKFSRFEVLPKVECHRFMGSKEVPQSKLFLTTLKKELKVLSTALPDGIFVRAFEDRNDLFSCLIVGAEDTPYEQGLFIFDIKLPLNFPHSPPEVLFLSYASGKLNPNLYEDGKICLSLLGTWNGKGTEVWSKDTSSLLQVFVSLQALILNKTPYFNEAGYEKQRSLLTGQENAKMYNEMVVLRLVEACTVMVNSPYETFEQEILEHFGIVGHKLIDRLQLWCDTHDSATIDSPPSFPLFPLSTGFRNSLHRELTKFKSAVCAKFEKKEENLDDCEKLDDCNSVVLKNEDET